MLFRCIDKTLIEINRIDFSNDLEYYKEIMLKVYNIKPPSYDVNTFLKNNINIV